MVDEALRYQIRELRVALGDNAQIPRFIETLHGRGYRFIGRIDIITLKNSNQIPIPFSSQLLSQSLSTLPGRTAELQQLQQWLETACTGERVLGFISGEPGIGKTTLLNVFIAGLHNAIEDYWISSGRCVEFYGINEAYLPLLDALEQLCRGRDGRYVVECLDQYAPSWLLQLPEFVQNREKLERRTQGVGHERMLREFAQVLELLSQERPLIICLEDLHWADSATLEQLAYLAQRPQSARLLVLGSYRPADAHANNLSLLRLLSELSRHEHCAEKALSLLDAAAINDYLGQKYPGLPATLGSLLQQRSGGNPLFC